MHQIPSLKTVRFSLVVGIMAMAILIGCVGVDGRPLENQLPFYEGFYQGCMNGTVISSDRYMAPIDPENAKEFCNALRDLFIDQYGVSEPEKPCTEGCI